MAADVDGPRGGDLQPGNHPQGGGLAAARGTEQGEERPLRHRQVEVVHRHEVGEPLGDPLQDQVAATVRRQSRVLHVAGLGHRHAPMIWLKSLSNSSRVLVSVAMKENVVA